MEIVSSKKRKIELIESTFIKNDVEKILKETIIGLPTISNFKYLTSENTIHQTSHLASYKRYTKKNIYENNLIVEWGGGYGCLARLVNKMNPACTYIIMDLPELSALQYVYLSSIFGRKAVNFINKEMNIEKGKINLISSDYFIHLDKEINADAFISNWALTESGKDYQDYIKKNNFFAAKDILIGCVSDENNYLLKSETKYFSVKASIDELGSGNFYLVK